METSRARHVSQRARGTDTVGRICNPSHFPRTDWKSILQVLGVACQNTANPVFSRLFFTSAARLKTAVNTRKRRPAGVTDTRLSDTCVHLIARPDDGEFLSLRGPAKRTSAECRPSLPAPRCCGRPYPVDPSGATRPVTSSGGSLICHTNAERDPQVGPKCQER